MRNIIAFVLTLFMTIGCTNAQTPKEFSKESLDYKMVTLEGSEISFKDVLKKYKGKTVVVDVWASWCPDCIKGMPKVVNLQNEFTDVVYLFISADKTPEAWKKGIEKYNVKGEHYLLTDGMKGAFGKSIKLDWIPRYMVVDKKGKIALFKAIEADDETLITTLKTLK